MGALKHKWTDSRGIACFGVWEKVVWGVGILWSLSFTILAFPDFSEEAPGLASLIVGFDKYLPVFFLIEYILRIAVSRARLRYIFSFMGLVDLVVCLPALLPLLGVDEASVLYSLRIVELFCIFKIIRFNRIFAPFAQIFKSIRKELYIFFGLFFFLHYFFAMGIYMAERKAQPEVFSSLLDGFWFAAVSLTTTGYGDVVPVTVLGKVFSGFMLVLGVAVVAVPTALITSSTTRLWQSRKLDMIEKAAKQASVAASAQLAASGEEAHAEQPPHSATPDRGAPAHPGK